MTNDIINHIDSFLNYDKTTIVYVSVITNNIRYVIYYNS